MARLQKLYEKLTARERLDMTIEALSRGDAAELDLLRDSVPRGTWEIPDPEYYESLQGLMLLGHVHALTRANKQTAFLLAMILRETDGKQRDDDGKLEEGLINLAEYMISIDEGWREFCAEIGYGDEMIAEAFLLGEQSEIDQVFDALFAATGIVADTIMTQQVREQYLAKWVRLSPLALRVGKNQ